jgi:hypothetical protein
MIVPERPGDQSVWRTLTDRRGARRPAPTLAAALPALIPKLIVGRSSMQ